MKMPFVRLTVLNMNDFTAKDEQLFRIRKRGNYMIAKQRGEGAHLLDALWLRTLGDVTSLRRLGFQCRNIGQKIAEHEISEMIEYLERERDKKKRTTGAGRLDGY
jgi:hypothetical protein